MPPKKKQQQIDLSTLPQCKSINAFLFCKGKKQRAQEIINKLKNQTKFISSVKKSEVLQHAKQKGIYVDPNSLTDKQKKDPKFMESVSTQLTPQIIAKSVSSYINQLNIKVRMEKKANADKPEEQRVFSHDRNFDWMYVFEDFPQETCDFEQIAKVGNNLKFAFVLSPQISWANAPQIPQPEEPQQGAQPQPEDEEIKQLKQLQAKEQLTEQDKSYQNVIANKINKLRAARAKASINSQFRNCAIYPLNFQIDPYNQNDSLNNLVTLFVEAVTKVSQDYDGFLTWKTQKTTQKIIEQKIKNKEQQKKEVVQQEQQKKQSEEIKQKRLKPSFKIQGSSIPQLLLNMGKKLDGIKNQVNKEEQWDDIQNIINNFDFNTASLPRSQYTADQNRVRKRTNPDELFRNQNQVLFGQGVISNQLNDLLNQLKYPGIKRHQMPQIPNKSQPLRKVLRSQYGQFLPKGLTLQQFQRRLALLNFEQILKQVDQQRNYKFDDRVYQQRHDRQSLMRQLYKSLLIDQSIVHTKYNQQNDSLYLSMVYKNPIRRVHKKTWEANWKVLPNFENWLQYFKTNDANLANNAFYEIDYQKIGNIQDQSKLYALKDGGIVVSKNVNVANVPQRHLFVIKDHATFGIKSNRFYHDNNELKVTHYLKNNQTQEVQTFLTFKDKKMICLKQSGDVVCYIQGQATRTYTPQGYTIIHNNDQSKILHPDGGISYPPHCYVNQFGRGNKNGQLYEVPTLKRRTENGQQITKRDDGTVIVKDINKKWVRFQDFTQYLHTEQEGYPAIVIEKKQFPLFRTIKKDNHITITINGIIITGQKNSQNTYDFFINFKDWSSIQIQGAKVLVAEKNLDPNYIFNLVDQSLCSPNDGQQLIVRTDGTSMLNRNGKSVNPLQQQQNYNQQDTLPKDHPQPRLFIISSNDSGVQLLSQKQLQHYFAMKKEDQNVNRLNQEVNDKLIIQMIAKVPTKDQINAKHIKPDFHIDLDIFHFEKTHRGYHSPSTYVLRSFIMHQPLSEEDRRIVNQICSQTQNWKKKYQKEQNQYGFCPKNQEIIQQKVGSKIAVLKYRKAKQDRIGTQEIRKDSINQCLNSETKRKTMILKQAQQLKLRKNMSFKSSTKPKYKWVEPRPKSPQQILDPNFYSNFFLTTQGKRVLTQMPEWVFRPKSPKQKKQLDPQIQSELNATMNKTNKTNQQIQQDQKIQEDQRQRYDTVDINISPQKQIFIKPSVFTKREIDQERSAFEEQKKAYQYHQIKRKDYNLYGKQRKNRIQVPSLMRTQPMSQINQKYLVTEAPLDKKVKISSMKNKLTSGASSLVQMRKEGPHATLIRTLDKKNDYDKLLDKRTMMVHADLNDKLQRDILINPIEANFGNVVANKTYQLKIEVKNQDVISQRLQISKARTIHVRTQMNDMGQIALGMTRKISVFLKTSDQILGKFNDQFDIRTKHQIYHIPVIANVLSEDQFRNTNILISTKIKEVPNRTLKKNVEELPPINRQEK